MLVLHWKGNNQNILVFFRYEGGNGSDGFSLDSE
jgi:hypothetical protein